MALWWLSSGPVSASAFCRRTDCADFTEENQDDFAPAPGRCWQNGNTSISERSVSVKSVQSVAEIIPLSSEWISQNLKFCGKFNGILLASLHQKSKTADVGKGPA
jgi:hypothetical protein